MSNEKLSPNLSLNLSKVKKVLSSSDIKIHEFFIGKTLSSALIYIDSLTDKKAIAQGLIKPLNKLTKTDFSAITQAIVSTEIKTVSTLNEIYSEVLLGKSALIIDGEKNAIIIEYKLFDKRAVTEPPTSVTLRGPREGFVENLSTNISLIRRRIKSNDLVFEKLVVGKYSRTDIVVCYIKGISRKSLVKTVIEKIKSVDIDGVFDSSYIAKFISEHKTSLFKQVGTTEKPDILVAKMLEGRISILVDGSPFALTVPYIIAEDFQSADDYYSSNYRAMAVRILRALSVFTAIILPALFVSAQIYHLQLLPLSFLLTIVNSVKGIPLSPSFEMFFTLMIFEILNEASIRMPKYVGMAVSIVGGLVLGETAVNAGIISAPALMIIAMSGICLYTVPEMVQTFSILRVVFLCVAGSIGGYCLILLSILILAYLVSFETFKTPLLAPFAPLIKQDLKDTFYKGFLFEMTNRPKTFRSKNKTRLKVKKSTKKQKVDNFNA